MASQHAPFFFLFSLISTQQQYDKKKGMKKFKIGDANSHHIVHISKINANVCGLRFGVALVTLVWRVQHIRSRMLLGSKGAVTTSFLYKNRYAQLTPR